MKGRGSFPTQGLTGGWVGGVVTERVSNVIIK